MIILTVVFVIIILVVVFGIIVVVSNQTLSEKQTANIKKVNISHTWKDIDQFYYINLIHRKDREMEFQEELEKMNISVTKVTKIYASKEKKGFMGCTKSHIRIFQNALSCGQNMVAIFEDDFMFNINFKNGISKFNEIWKQYPNTDVIMLAANPVKIVKSKVPQVYRVKQALSTAGYIVRRSYFQTMLKNLHESFHLKRPCDVGFCYLQEKDNWYVLQPAMGQQRPSFSDIESRFVDYRQIETNFLTQTI